MIQIIWEYKVKPEMVSAFEAAYGKNGDWHMLFKKSKAYKGTELIVNNSENHVYITIDKWKSIEQYDQFLKQNNKEYNRLNQSFKNLFTKKEELGIFSEE